MTRTRSIRLRAVVPVCLLAISLAALTLASVLAIRFGVVQAPSGGSDGR